MDVSLLAISSQRIVNVLGKPFNGLSYPYRTVERRR